MKKKLPFEIIDYVDNPNWKSEKPASPELIPESMGYNLDTIEKARAWLVHPQNWFKSELFILKWDGIVPKISESKARWMIENPQDDGLAWAAMYGQKIRRAKKERGEDLSDREAEVADDPA